MCGLYVSFGMEPAAERLARVAHRGPDGSGWRVFTSPAGPVVLGHRRLAILDLSDRAAQPMSCADERYWVVHNGEVYNFRALRSQLEGEGITFRTGSDTEVVLAAYRRWGPACVERLNGMFAFVIWDDVAKRLFVARDRFGIKPLYVAPSGRGSAWASEIKQLADINGAPRACDEGVLDFLETGLTSHTTTTMFQGVLHFPAAHAQIIDLAAPTARVPEPVPYWRPPAPGAIGTRLREAACGYRERFHEAIERHLISDVEIGSCLSGGIDSTAITLAAARRLGRPLIAVSAVFPGSDVDETPFVDIVARTGLIRSVRVEMKAEHAFADLDAVAAVQDEPFGSASILVQSRVFSAARDEGVKVMLDGQGADELTGGYPDLYPFAIRDLLRDRDVAGLIAHMLGSRATRSIASQLEPFVRSLLRTPASSRALVRRDAPGGVLSRALAEAGYDSSKTLAEHCRALTTTLSLPALLRYEDRNSMQVGIEARVPYLDAELAEYCLALDGAVKISRGATKAVMREGLAGVLPVEIAQRRDKIGFAAPQAAWLRGVLREEARRRAREAVEMFASLIDRSAAEHAIARGLDGKGDLSSVWRLMSLGAWARAFDISFA